MNRVALKRDKSTDYTKEGSQPKFCKARLVRYAMKPKVEVELKRLEEGGIMYTSQSVNRRLQLFQWSSQMEM